MLHRIDFEANMTKLEYDIYTELKVSMLILFIIYLEIAFYHLSIVLDRIEDPYHKIDI